jgi:hypothetical protein
VDKGLYYLHVGGVGRYVEGVVDSVSPSGATDAIRDGGVDCLLLLCLGVVVGGIPATVEGLCAGGDGYHRTRVDEPTDLLCLCYGPLVRIGAAFGAGVCQRVARRVEVEGGEDRVGGELAAEAL